MIQYETTKNGVKIAKFNGRTYYYCKKTSYYMGKNSKYLHRDVYLFHNNMETIPTGHVIHHSDFNKLNNDINNLVLLTTSQHLVLHNRLRKGTTYKKKNKKM